MQAGRGVPTRGLSPEPLTVRMTSQRAVAEVPVVQLEIEPTVTLTLNGFLKSALTELRRACPGRLVFRA